MSEESKREWGPEDEQAAAEGRSISLGNARRVRITSKKSKIRNVNKKVLNDAFDGHYGDVSCRLYIKKGDEENDGSNDS